MGSEGPFRLIRPYDSNPLLNHMLLWILLDCFTSADRVGVWVLAPWLLRPTQTGASLYPRRLRRPRLWQQQHPKNPVFCGLAKSIKYTKYSLSLSEDP